MTKFQKKLLFDVGISVIIIGALAAGIIFFSSNLKTFAGKIGSTRKEIEKRSNIVGGLAKLRSQEREFGDTYLQVLYNYIPSEDELINFESKVQRVAEREGVGFGFSYVGDIKKNIGALGEVKFALSLQAESQQKIINVIRRLQDFQNLIQVETFSISRKAPNVKGVISAVVFFRPQE